MLWRSKGRGKKKEMAWNELEKGCFLCELRTDAILVSSFYAS